MKTISTILTSALLLSTPILYAQSTYEGTEPLGMVSYALPKTTLTFDVEATCEHFYAGPYAKYASKYLGIEAKDQDQTTYKIASVKMTAFLEADQSRRFLIAPGANTPSFLKLTAQGLVSTGSGNFGNASQWRFPSAGKSDFAEKGVSSNLTSESTTLYKNIKTQSVYNTVAVQQDMVVEKSLDKRAQEAADMIFSLRKTRVQIVSGNTDATFSGEAMGSVINELDALEKEYLSMFIGYSDTSIQQMKFEVVPDKANAKQIYVPFRISDESGLVAADNVTGKPLLLEIVPDKMAEAESTSSDKASRGASYAYYRRPAVCTVKLSNEGNLLLQDRVPIYQLGIESSFPFVNSKK
jgi:hypothetical protein